MIVPVLVLLRCHSGAGAGATPVSLQCWCYSGVTPVLVSLQGWCSSSFATTRCKKKKLFKSAINYVQSKIIAQSQLYYQQNMFNCYVCGEFFTRQFSLKRHMKRKHAQPNVESMKENPKNHRFTENSLMLRHPFTMMVAASTGGGKTWLVKNLLENRQQWISPALQ